MQNLITGKLFYQLLTGIMMLGLLFTFSTSTHAQTTNNFARSKVVAVNGSMLECEAGIAFDVSGAEIVSQISKPQLSDIVPGSWVSMEVGEFQPSQSTSTRTVFKASNILVELKKDVYVSGDVQKIDPNRNSLTILGKEIFVDGSTQFFKKKKKKLKNITFSELEVGMRINIEAEPLSTGLTARRVITTPSGFGELPTVIGFIESYQDNVATMVGGFVVDFSLFKEDLKELQAGLRVVALLNPEKTDNPLLSTGYGFAANVNGFNGNLEGVDVANRTITISNRTFQVNNIAIFGPDFELDKLKVGLNTFVSVRLISGNPVVVGLEQIANQQ